MNLIRRELFTQHWERFLWGDFRRSSHEKVEGVFLCHSGFFRMLFSLILHKLNKKGQEDSQEKAYY